MLEFRFAPGTPEKLSVLLLGAHSDDIEIGCGGTILRLAREVPQLEVTWVVFCAEGRREEEARRSAELFLRNAGKTEVEVHDHRDGFLPYSGGVVKDRFELLKKKVAPDVVFTHFRDDRHQDHRIISDLTWNTFREHLILEYEVPKFDGDLGSPNFFVGLDTGDMEMKIGHLMTAFESQKTKHWFTRDTFLAIARLRGIESPRKTAFAEAFYCRKIALSGSGILRTP